MNRRMETFDEGFDEGSEMLVKMAEKDMDWLADPFKPMVLDMNPGAGVGVDGNLIQAPSFEMQLKKSAQVGQDWGDGIGGSKTPVLLSTRVV